MGNEKKFITSDNWSVSATVRKKAKFNYSLPHMSLILEGMTNNRRFVVKADLSYVRHSDGVPKEVCILAEPFIDIDKLYELRRESSIQQFFINEEKGHILLDEIRKDQRSILKYNIGKRNCKTWVKTKLKHIDLELAKHWFDIIVDYPK